MNDVFGSELNEGDKVIVSISNPPSAILCIAKVVKCQDPICWVSLESVPSDSNIFKNEIRTVCDSWKLLKV